MKILIDTREQTPLEFNGYHCQVERETLAAGDYTLVGHDLPDMDNSIIFERKKNCSELIGNLGTHWDRFQREAEILSTYKYKQIVVCSPDNFELLNKQGYTKLSVNFIYSRLSQLLCHFHLPCIFFPSPDLAENYIFRTFNSILRKTSNEA